MFNLPCATSQTNIFERICRRNVYQTYPVISVLFCTATPLWVLFFGCALLICRSRARSLPAPLISIFLWGSYLVFGPCTLPRYMLPLFCFAPVLLISALILPIPQNPAKE